MHILYRWVTIIIFPVSLLEGWTLHTRKHACTGSVTCCLMPTILSLLFYLKHIHLYNSLSHLSFSFVLEIQSIWRGEHYFISTPQSSSVTHPMKLLQCSWISLNVITVTNRGCQQLPVSPHIFLTELKEKNLVGIKVLYHKTCRDRVAVGSLTQEAWLYRDVLALIYLVWRSLSLSFSYGGLRTKYHSV